MTLLEKLGIALCLVAIVVVLFLIVFAQNGILDYRALKKKETQIQTQTQAVDNANKALESEIKKLKTDIDYIKHVAKHDYDMTEENEMIFKDSQDEKGKKP